MQNQSSNSAHEAFEYRRHWSTSIAMWICAAVLGTVLATAASTLVDIILIFDDPPHSLTGHACLTGAVLGLLVRAVICRNSWLSD